MRTPHRQTSDRRCVRLLFLTTDLGMGGAERHAVNVATGLDPAKVAVRLLCVERRGERFGEVQAANVPAASLDAGDRWWLSAAGLVPRMRAILRRSGFDVVMTNGYSAEVLARLAACGTGIPVLAWKHNFGHIGRFGTRDRLTERVLGRCNRRYLAVSHRQVDYLVDHMGIDRRAITVIHNSVRPVEPMSPDDRAALRRELGVPAAADVVMCVAGLRAEKDHATLLHAFARIHTARRDTYLCLVGDGPERGSLARLAADLGVAENVRFTGNRDDAERLIQAADVAVLTSYSIENFPYAILEAMAAGVPAVCTSVGGIPEMIEDGVTGRLVPPHDPEALAAAILWVLSPIRRDVMGRAARERLVDAFPYDRFLLQVEEVITDETQQ